MTGTQLTRPPNLHPLSGRDPLRQSGPDRQDRLCAIQGLVWDFSSTHSTIALLGGSRSVSYTHLTLPTNREV